ncbi:heparanase-like isoform X2 [Corticium candelabrum]|uniref:heparanase-like isoform X2 n=1 Tax=Corticium candelabrum TaxID=121492 RepID=UPI002E274055|nr:heparanase-like isoform X2 [Corticium candelabrum]
MAMSKPATASLFIRATFLVCFCTAQLLDIDTDKPAFHIPRHFVSLSSSPKTIIVHNSKMLRRMINSEVFQSLIRGLSPAYWRLGGREALLVTFANQSDDCPPPHYGSENSSDGDTNSVEATKRKIPLCLTSTIFDELYRLTMTTSNLLLFDLNDRVRFGDGSWDYRNVRKLVDYVMEKRYNVSWQLGNEPSSYFHQFNIVVEPEQLVQDYKTLRKLVGVKQIVVGPEMVDIDPHRYLDDELSRQKYFQRWEVAGGGNFVNATSWHFYYLHRPPNESDMYSSRVLDELLIAINTTESYSTGDSVDYWLTETGNFFRWLHKLGIASRKGHTVVCHETLITFSRGLLDPSFDPQVTYWLSYLFKRLVGTGSLEVKGQLQLNRQVHTFAFCTNAADVYVKRSYVPSDVTLLVINIQQSIEATISLPSRFMHNMVDVYHLTPADNNLTSTSIMLNGKKMQLGHNHQLPLLTPIEQAGSKVIRLPPLTYGFYVIRNATASGCL